MNGFIRKLAALLFAAAMITAFTPLLGTGSYTYADDDDPFENIQIFSLERIGGEFDRLFSDGSIKYRIPDEALNYDDSVVKIVPFVGIPQDDSWESLDNDCFSYDDNTKTITIYGNKIEAKYPAPDYGAPNNIGVSFEGQNADGTRVWITGINNLVFRYAYSREDLQEDRTVLPGWDGSINGYYEGYIEDSEHPGGERFWLATESVEVVEGRDLLEDFHEDSDDDGNRWWYYRAGRERGKVTFRITYTSLDGSKKTYDANLFISDHVYDGDLFSDGDVNTGLPGSEIKLNAWAEHKYMNAEDREEITAEGIDFIWEVEEGNDIARIEPDPSDHSKASLIFNDLSEGEDYIDRGVRVRLKLIDRNSDDPEEVRVDREMWFNDRSDYCEIFPAGLNMFINVGETIENQKFEVRHYKYGAAGQDGFNDDSFETIDDARFEWEDVDQNAVRISGSGDTYSITRLAGYYTDFRLKATWGEDGYTDREYRFLNKNYDIWFEDYDNLDVYDDTGDDPQFRLNIEQFGDNFDNLFNYEITAGEWDGRNDKWTKKLSNSDYDVTIDGHFLVITFDKDKILNFDCRDIRLLVEISSKDSNIDLHRDRDAWINVRETRYDVDWEDHRDMLPGWDGWINNSYHAYIENSEFPDGRDFEFEVTDVDVIEGMDKLEFFNEEEDGWAYKAKENGHVVFRIHYKDEHGDAKTHDMELNISGDVYEAWIENAEPYDQGLPGTSMELSVNAVHKYLDEHGSYQEDREGLTYEWELKDGGEFAVLKPHSDDPSRATLTFNKLPQGENWIDEEVNVRVAVKDKDTQQECTDAWRFLRVKSEFEEIWPADFGEILNVGQSTDKLKVEVRRYSSQSTAQGGYKTIKIEKAQWDFDENKVKITGPDGTAVSSGQQVSGDSFAVTRLAEWGTDVFLKVWYRDENGWDCESDRNYWLDDLNYNIWFEPHDEDVYDDYECTVRLEKEDYLNYDGIDIRITSDAPETCWKENDDKSVTVYGDKMDAEGIDHIDFRAEAYIGDRYIDRWDECHIELRESCTKRGEEHDWLKGNTEYTDCVSPGTQKIRCDKCGEERINKEVAPRGHDWGKVTYTWSAGNTKCTAKRSCKRAGCGKVETETVTAKSAVTKKATLQTNGERTFTAVFKNKAFAKQTKKASISNQPLKAAAAAAEAARQGTPDGKIAKVTISKPASKKTSVTVKWKKLASKKLNKGKVTHYEVWLCPNKAFKKGETAEVLVKKGKGSVTVKKLGNGTALKKKTKYFVKVRAVRKAGNKKYVGKWSKVKSIKTKK